MASPLELLTNRGDRQPSYLNDKWNPLICSAVGFGAVCYINWATRRPVFSGVQRHAAAVLGGAALGVFIDKKRNDYLAERDAVLRHYVELHPEDFPTPERKKIGETLEAWAPIR
ncbi:unnamed protein product [Hermetia illucens]|uniref:NADH dehydrogenase [ubiquinone] 1 subunit C2 n=1 Tax=Hermetia illucens TaxID=343691 RepID=A0A7R8UGN0_HERIL|nr:NADH dehydrogenase [ubiquinone] 1 subunit C2 [Hermetia illucens]CAD7079657.1 unnamed protein product [Hermetia illucens]